MKMKITSLDKTVSFLQIPRAINQKQKHTYGYKLNWVNRCVTTIPTEVRER